MAKCLLYLSSRITVLIFFIKYAFFHDYQELDVKGPGVYCHMVHPYWLLLVLRVTPSICQIK